MDSKNLNILTDEKAIDLIYLLQKQKLIRTLKLKDKDHLVFQNPYLLSWVIKKGKKKQQTFQKWRSIYYRKEFQMQNHPKFVIRKTDSYLGFGLFTKEDVSKGSYLGEYTGVVRPHKKEDKKNPFLVLYPIRYKYFRKLVIDGSKIGNHTRFIKHSHTPNAQMISIFYQNIPRMIFISSQNISRGSQIMIDYGRLFFKQLRKKNRCSLKKNPPI